MVAVDDNRQTKTSRVQLYIAWKQGQIHDYPSRVRVGRGHILGPLTIWVGAVRSKNKDHREKSRSHLVILGQF